MQTKGITLCVGLVILLYLDFLNPLLLSVFSSLQIHYDHQVLLDYLISRDTGDRCAEYLLRYVFFQLPVRNFSSYLVESHVLEICDALK